MGKELFIRLALKFKPNIIPLRNSLDDEIIGFIHSILGKCNKWHDSFSRYSISSMCGGKIVDGMYVFDKGGTIYVSSSDEEFILTFLANLKKVNGFKVCGFEYIGYDYVSNEIMSNYDIVKTLSPILLKTSKDKVDKYITIENKEEFFKTLNEHCYRKLKNQGFTDNDLKGFLIEPFHFECASLKKSHHKNYTLPCSKLMMIIKGKSVCRKCLYEIGIGSSTGYCFGSIEIKNIQK